MIRRAALTQASARALAEAEAAALQAEAAHSAARQNHDLARQPLADAERRAQRLETEARTLAKLLRVDAKELCPPVIDLLTVEKGYETALGTALGDDLNAPIEPTAPIRWGLAAGGEVEDPALPEGVEALVQHLVATPQAAAARANRRRRACRRRRRGAAIEGGPAPRVAPGRPLALGRLRGRRPCPHRGRAAACRSQPARGHRNRT
jgi:hypothetical protein